MPTEFLECWIEKAPWLGLARTSWWMSGGHHGCRWGIRRPGLGISTLSSRPNPENSRYIWAFIIPTLRSPEMMSSLRIPQIHTSLSKTTPACFTERRLGAQNNTMSQCRSLSMCPWHFWLSTIPTGAFAADLEPVPKSQLLPIWLICWLHSRWPAYGKGGVTPWHSRGIIRGKPARMRHLAELSETLSISGTWNTRGPQRHQGVTLACPQCP